jgi:DNA-binding response OmpR family regulator
MVSAPSTHIVVVDDDPKVRTLLRRAFEPEGFRVSEASDSDALFALLRAGRFDLITLDLTLRNENGLEVARRIRVESRVPIIMVTGKGDMIDRIVGLELGADDYISKPFHIREVLARVRTVLRRASPESSVESTREATADKDPVIRFSGWQLDLPKRELKMRLSERALRRDERPMITRSCWRASAISLNASSCSSIRQRAVTRSLKPGDATFPIEWSRQKASTCWRANRASSSQMDFRSRSASRKPALCAKSGSGVNLTASAISYRI